jgi:hypothetical protein
MIILREKTIPGKKNNSIFFFMKIFLRDGEDIINYILKLKRKRSEVNQPFS